MRLWGALTNPVRPPKILPWVQTELMQEFPQSTWKRGEGVSEGKWGLWGGFGGGLTVFD